MLNKFKGWWKRQQRKRFRVIGEYSVEPRSDELTNHNQPVFSVRRKEFRVIGEYSVEPRSDELTNHNQSVASARGFSIAARTRPKQCPLCRTADKIVRLESTYWKCEECGHTWR